MKTETLHVTETEERILNAALKVVNDVTISGTRMHLIADKADMCSQMFTIIIKQSRIC